MPSPTLYLTDGTTTLQLNDELAYALANQGWAPQIARRRAGTLSGPPYDAVLEEPTVHVLGKQAPTDEGTAARVITNLRTLNEFLDRVADGAVLRVGYIPIGSTRTQALEAPILDARDDRRTPTLPVSFNSDLVGYHIPNVRAPLLRGGLWLDALSTAVQSSALTNSSIVTANLGTALRLPGPTKVELEVRATLDVDVGVSIGPSVLIVAPTERLLKIEAESLTIANAPATAVVADSANNASDGSVLRAGVSSTNVWTQVTFPSSTGTWATNVRNVEVLFTARPTDTTSEFQVRINLGSGASTRTSDPVTIPSGSVQARVYTIGEQVTRYGPQTISLEVQRTAGTGSLDMDYLVLVGVDDAESAIWQIMSSDIRPNFYLTLRIDPDPLTYRTPLLEVQPDANTAGMSALQLQGPSAYYTRAASLSAIWMAPLNNATTWRHQWGDTLDISTTRLRVQRRASFLSPE